MVVKYLGRRVFRSLLCIRMLLGVMCCVFGVVGGCFRRVAFRHGHTIEVPFDVLSLVNTEAKGFWISASVSARGEPYCDILKFRLSSLSSVSLHVPLNEKLQVLGSLRLLETP
jgi:hypothetical protein